MKLYSSKLIIISIIYAHKESFYSFDIYFTRFLLALKKIYLNILDTNLR